MKAVFISYNQTLTKRVLYMLEKLEIRGYTRWKDVSGKGSIDGEPREGTHNCINLLRNNHVTDVE